MFSAFSLLALCTLSINASASRMLRPEFGIEPTATNATMIEARKHNGVGRFYRLWDEFREHDIPAALLHRWAEEFPEQHAVFEDFARIVFSGRPMPTLELHKGAFPSYRVETSAGWWFRIQFEYQCVEAQFEPSTLVRFLGRASFVDHIFFGSAERAGLAPRRDCGMGHINEGLDQGYEKPETLRNRIVSELNHRWFYLLVGPDVQAVIPGMYRRTHLNAFAAWLPKFDRWIAQQESIHDDAERDRLITEIGESIHDDPIFEQTELTRAQDIIHPLIYAREIKVVDMDAFKWRRFLVRLSLRQLMREAYRGVTFYENGSSFQIKMHEDIARFETGVLEFRRIPAQKNADEIAMWMRLLEGRWSRARLARNLVPLHLTGMPANDDERVAIFRKYIEYGTMNPVDFADFLEPRLRSRIQDTGRYARWPVLRSKLCERHLR